MATMCRNLPDIGNLCRSHNQYPPDRVTKSVQDQPTYPLDPTRPSNLSEIHGWIHSTSAWLLHAINPRLPIVTTPDATHLLMLDSSAGGSRRTRIGSEPVLPLSLLSHVGDVDVSHFKPPSNRLATMKLTGALWYSLFPANRDHKDDPRTDSCHKSIDKLESLGGLFGS